jgi:hypothetical protein
MNSSSPSMAIQTDHDLLNRIDQEILQDIVASSLLIGKLDKATCHLHRSIQGAKGYSGMTTIVSLQYSDDNYGAGWVDVLLKWSRWATSESRWYPALMAAGAPVPRLLGSLQLRAPPTDISDEVLVLEYLPHIGYGDRDRLALAVALGRFHALSPELISDLPNVTAASAVAGWTEVWQRIPIHANAGELGSAIAELVPQKQKEWDQVLSALPRVAADVDGLPRGIIHRDVSFQNTGWRADRRELLLFDIPQMAVGILAQDAQALFPIDQPFDNTIAEQYLTTLRKNGGQKISPTDFKHAIELMRPMALLNFLWWSTARSCDGQVDFTKDIEEGRRWYRRVLHSNLGRLLDILGHAKT